MQPLTVHDADDAVVISRAHGEVRLDRATGRVAIGGVELELGAAVEGERGALVATEVVLADPVLARVVQTFDVGDGLSTRVTWDVHMTRNVHAFVRVTATRDTSLATLELPRVGLPDAAGALTIHDADGERWATLSADGAILGVIVKKRPWLATWDDVGAHGHRTIGTAALVATVGGLALDAGSVTLAPGRTIEAAVILRQAEGLDDVRAEATYGHPDEVRYVPEGEFRHQRVWETEDVWLGPPIFDGCQGRPYDQLIPRPLGLNVLARKRFTWSNEDFALWQLTGKERYHDSGIKKAHALLATQNEHGGWYEGIEFYNLPPEHHHMYDTYIGGMFLLEAYDRTGHQAYLDAARRCKEFWLGPPPANGHVDVAPDAWWYRWGGYINEYGYTDERLVLNTHSGATEFLALYAQRSGDAEALEAARNGLAAVRWGLERGIQRGDGQFLYCLSQVDPTRERPGDPPYLRLDLVPQIEDVYTVASSYRLMVANRVLDDEVIWAAIRRALDYWWRGYKAGTVYTYRAYAAIAYGVAAGEIDLRYALALGEILRDPQHFTSLQRGRSPFVAPHGLPAIHVDVEGPASLHVEPVFMRRRSGEAMAALVNVEQPLAAVPVRIALPEGASLRRVSLIDPASADLAATPLTASVDERGIARVVVPELHEFGVAVLHVEVAEPGA